MKKTEISNLDVSYSYLLRRLAIFVFNFLIVQRHPACSYSFPLQISIFKGVEYICKLPYMQ